jgi:tryptophanyl-tRNA synthetase
MTLDETSSHAAPTTAGVAKKLEQIVNPWEISAADEYGIDYDKLIEQFGTRRIDEATLERFEKLTGHKPHRYLRRGHFFSQRYVDPWLGWN